jgi:hypothetical protein
MRSRSFRDHRGERGASLLEFALVLPLFALFAFGVIEFSLAFTDLNGLRNGAREGARSAVVASFGTDLSCPIRGVTPNDDTKALICRTKARTQLGEDEVRMKLDWPQLYRPGDPLTICAQYPVKSFTGMLNGILGGKIQHAKVEMRIETIDTDLEEFAETPLPGGSWSWC